MPVSAFGMRARTRSAVLLTGLLCACGASALPTDFDGTRDSATFGTDPGAAGGGATGMAARSGGSAGVAARSGGSAGAAARSGGAAASGGPGSIGSGGVGGSSTPGSAGIGTGPSAGTAGKGLPPNVAGRGGSIGVPPPDIMPPIAGATSPTQPLCNDGDYIGDLIIRSQRDIAFIKGCRQIHGNLYISTQQLSDLHGLEALNIVDGTLRVAPDEFEGFPDPPASQSALMTLSGLEGLQRANALELSHLDVGSLQPLARLEVAASLTINQLNALQNLKGLENADWYEARIEQNSGLQTLDGLKPSNIAAVLTVSLNPKLVSVAALRPLGHLISLSLDNLPALTSLDGLQNVSIDAQLGIEACGALKDLSGLHVLDQPGIGVGIRGNQQLQSLKGLSVQAPNASSIVLDDNPQLTSLSDLLGPKTASVDLLALSRLPQLKTLAGFEGLTTAMIVDIESCDGLTDLTGLTQFGGSDLEIVDCANLQSLKGLDSLQMLGLLSLSKLPALTSLAGAPKLSTVTQVRIDTCTGLSDLSGLESVQAIDTVALNDNSGLKSLHGLEAAKTLQELDIVSSPALTSLTGLPAVTTMRTIYVAANSGLKDLTALSSLSTLDALVIDGERTLQSLAGLEKLTSVSTGVWITNNDTLTSLHALASLKSVPGVAVIGNTRLPECEVTWLGKQLQIAVQTGSNGPSGTCM